MRILRSVVALVLSTALLSLNAGAVHLHVHSADAARPGHHHGPALHHHDAAPHPVDGDVSMAAVDADDTVVGVALCSVAPSHEKSPLAIERTAATVEPRIAGLTIRRAIVTRAHGPPAHGHSSLRAPPLATLA